MGDLRKQHSGSFKARVAVVAVRLGTVKRQSYEMDEGYSVS